MYLHAVFKLLYFVKLDCGFSSSPPGVTVSSADHHKSITSCPPEVKPRADSQRQHTWKQKKQNKRVRRHEMDVTEVQVSQGNTASKWKKKTPKKKRSGHGEGRGAERKVEEEEDEKKMEKSEEAFPPNFSVSEIKNKQRRHLMFMKIKQEKRKVRGNPMEGRRVRSQRRGSPALLQIHVYLNTGQQSKLI